MIYSNIPVLCYHNVSDKDGHTPDMFRQHLDAVYHAGWRTLSSSELLAVTLGQMKPPKKSLVLTFDDGHVSNWLTVVPELEKRGMVGTFFILVDFTVPGDVRTPETAPKMSTMKQSFQAAFQDGDYSQFINESEVKAMLDKGMEVYSHGCRHQGVFLDLKPLVPQGHKNAHWGGWSLYPRHDDSWPTFKVVSAYVYNGFRPHFDGGAEPRFVKRSTEERAAFCREDFQKSFERIQALNGYAKQLFCWPWGQFDETAEKELKAAGYSGAFTLDRWSNTAGTDPFRLHRIGVSRFKDARWLLRRLSMYKTTSGAKLFFKLYKKRPEVDSVLFVTDSDKLSGGSRQLITNVKAMADMGVKTYALVTPTSAINAALEKLDVDVVHFDRFRHYLQAGAFLKKLTREKKIDVVHSFHNRAYKAGVLARIMGAKFKLFINRGVISRPNAIFFAWVFFAGGVIANSQRCADVLRRHWVRKSALNVVYNAYSGPDFGEPALGKERGARFIYIGNSAHIKGFDLFLRAAEAVCCSGIGDVEFAGIGVPDGLLAKFEDVLSPEVRKLYTNYGILPHAEVLNALLEADVQVISSRMESLPNTLLEGFTLGVPAVCTRVGGIPELVRDGVNGYLCDSEDIDCLAEKMILLAGDSAKRMNMGRVGRNIVRRLLTPEAKGRNLMRVYMGETLIQSLFSDEAER